jgi:hypothetical protein
MPGHDNPGTRRSSMNQSMQFDNVKDDVESKRSGHSGGKEIQIGSSILETFIKAQIEDKTNIPPVRVMVVGDDKQFFKFVKDYV